MKPLTTLRSRIARLFSVTLLGCLFGAMSISYAAIPASERAVLQALYTSTNGAGWTTNTNWNGVPGTECTWFGVTCVGDANVTQINLIGNNLIGTLPPTLNQLTALEQIYLDDNQLSGTIPSFTGLTGLRVFAAPNNQLSGSIPSLVGLNLLQDVYLYNNQLTGSIPALIGSTLLGEFYVQDNQLSGSIPSLTGLTALREFSVAGNLLTGALPSLSGLTALNTFEASSNDLTGPIPSFDGLTALGRFRVGDNQLTGAIPELSGLTSLTVFHAYINNLTGSIPQLAGLTSLISFDVDFNQLSGPIPSLAGLPSLVSFSARANDLTGFVPPLSGLTALGTFDVGLNQLTGSLPSLVGLENLYHFDACKNQLTGAIPSLTGLVSLQTFYVCDNHLSGAIPALTGLNALLIFVANNNQLSGAIPAFTGLTVLRQFQSSQQCHRELHTPPSTWVLLRLWRFAKPYQGQLLLGFLLMMGATGATLVPPYLTMPLMDQVLIPFQNGQPIDRMLVGMLLAGLFGAAMVSWLLGWAKTYILALVSERIAADLRTATFEHLLGLSLEYFGNKRTGDLMARIGSETDRISVFLSLHALDFITDVLMLGMTALILFSIHPGLALATLVPLPFIAWLIHLVRDRLRTGFEKIDRVWGEVTSVLADTIPGIRVVKAFAQEKRETDRFREANANNLAVNDKLNKTWSLFGPTVGLLTEFGLLVVWATGIWLVSQGVGHRGCADGLPGLHRPLLRPTGFDEPDRLGDAEGRGRRQAHL